MNDVSQVGHRRVARADKVLVRLVVCALISTWALPAGAAEGDGANKVEAFREHVAQGAELRKQQKYREALEHFDKARAIADHPKLMMVTAQLRESVGDCPKARADYEQALADERASKELRAKLEEALAANKQCESRGTIVVECTPAGAEVRTAAREVACGERVELAAGTHTLVGTLEGYRDQQTEVTVAPGGQHTYQVTLTEIPAEPKEPVAAVPKWMTYTAYGSVGAGATLLVAGFISDASAAGRQEDLHQAHTQGDVSRANQLVDEAESARTRTAVFYTSGAILAAAGGLLWVYDEEAASWLAGDDAAVEPQVSVGPRGASVGATIRW